MQFLLLISFTLMSFHPVHVAFTNVEYDNDKQEILIASRIFYDDMELAVEQLFDADLQLGTDNEHPESDKFISLWYASVFEISINGEKIPPENIEFIRRETDDLAMRLFFRIKSEFPKQISIKNLILTDLYADQANLMILKVGNLEESFSLTEDNNVVTLEVE